MEIQKEKIKKNEEKVERNYIQIIHICSQNWEEDIKKMIEEK